MVKKYALIGDPVTASLSPAMMKVAFHKMGLNASYEAITLKEEELFQKWKELKESYLGLNVTRPLKEAVAKKCDRLIGSSKLSNSVNTVCFLEDGSAVGYSTDGIGVVRAMERHGFPETKKVFLIGTGGAARAVAAELLERGMAVKVFGRNRAAGERMAKEIGAEFMGEIEGPEGAKVLALSNLLINATPLGGVEYLERMPITLDLRMMKEGRVVELVSVPRLTPLVREALGAGIPTVVGLEVLVEQGAEAIRIWTGQEAPVEEMMEATQTAVLLKDAAR